MIISPMPTTTTKETRKECKSAPPDIDWLSLVNDCRFIVESIKDHNWKANVSLLATGIPPPQSTD